MTIGGKVAEALPDSWIEYIHDHPRALYLISVPLVLFATYNLEAAWRLHTAVEHHVREHASELARAASEALGG